MDNDKYQILIVSASAAADDMRLSLAEEGFTAVEISDYDNVLEHIQRSLPDLILLTKQAGHSSLLLTSKISRQNPMIPVVMVATEIHGETLREHLEAGASDYLYYTGAEKELLGFVVRQNLEHRLHLQAIATQQETATRYAQLEKDQRSGFRVQQAMLPGSPASIRGLTFDHQLYPSLIMSGDFIDYFELPDGRVAFYIADVSGHGASSAFITVLLKSMSRRLTTEQTALTTTAEILGWFNRELLQWQLEHHVTMFLGIIDHENRRLDYSSAAHFPGTILCYEEGADFLEIGGQPLGLFQNPNYRSAEVALPEKYCLVMFSDGVFEVLPEASLEAKEERLLHLVRSNSERELDALIDGLGILEGPAIPDDIAVFRVASGA